MTQEDKELLLKDLCARLPYGVKLQNVNNIESIVKLRSIDLDNDCCEILFYTYQGKALTICDKSKLFRFGKILRYKPYLFPLSSMTEEQFTELRNETELNQYPNDLELVEWENNYKTLEFYLEEVPSDVVIEVFDWLNKNHFDYRGLIEKGLAIDATGLGVY